MEQKIDSSWAEYSYFEYVVVLMMLGLGSFYAIYTVRLKQIDLTFVDAYYQVGCIASLSTYLLCYGISNIKKILVIWLLGCVWWLAPLGIIIGAGYLFAYSYAITLLWMVLEVKVNGFGILILIIEAILLSTYYLKSIYTLRMCVLRHFNKQIGYKASKSRYKDLIEGVKICIGIIIVEYFRLFV